MQRVQIHSSGRIGLNVMDPNNGGNNANQMVFDNVSVVSACRLASAHNPSAEYGAWCVGIREAGKLVHLYISPHVNRGSYNFPGYLMAETASAHSVLVQAYEEGGGAYKSRVKYATVLGGNINVDTADNAKQIGANGLLGSWKFHNDFVGGGANPLYTRLGNSAGNEFARFNVV